MTINSELKLDTKDFEAMLENSLNDSLKEHYLRIKLISITYRLSHNEIVSTKVKVVVDTIEYHLYDSDEDIDYGVFEYKCNKQDLIKDIVDAIVYQKLMKG